MKIIAEKLRDLELRIAAERGTFSFFALFLREDSPDKWDLVASSAWLETNKEEGLSYLAKMLRTALAADELMTLSRIVTIDQNDPALQAIHKALKTEHSVIEVKDVNFFGLQIKHAYVITSQHEAETVGREAK